uniref:Low-density lipoprotein receptor-related protein 11 n=1 Tax=Oryctolagus cuniculus TaxID=9986 RepID=A0A5F9DAQ8_RABIT
MAFAAREGACSWRRLPTRNRVLRGLQLLCLRMVRERADGTSETPRSDLQAMLSGVEQLLEEFCQELQLERPQEELELELPRRAAAPGRAARARVAAATVPCRTPSSAPRTPSRRAPASLSAPATVRDWRQCVAACCSEPRCSVAVVELPRRPAPPAAALGCYLFNCTVRGRSVCKFALHRGYSSYSLSRVAAPDAAWASPGPEKDEPPQSKAGQNVVLHLPTDEVTLDGRESTDDHAIVQYEWTLLQGDPAVDMKVPQSGTLKLAHLQEGTYTFQLTVTDTAGQRASDNVSVTVLPMAHSTEGCLGACSRYHFFCDDGCCIDITLACDGVQQCPDGSDEAFCQNLGLDRKMVTHAATSPAQPRTTALSEDTGGVSLLEKSQEATAADQPAPLANPEKRNHSASAGTGSQVVPVMPDRSSSGKKRKEENYIFESKSSRGEHPAPETGAVLPLALGLAISALLLLMVACRLRLVKQKLKKARPITSEESDYLINGMYL